MQKNYANITDEDFERILRDILRDMTGEQLISIFGIYEILSEEFNNDVLTMWEEEQGLKEEKTSMEIVGHVCGRCDSIERGFDPMGYVYPVSLAEAEAISRSKEADWIYRCTECRGYTPGRW